MKHAKRANHPKYQDPYLLAQALDRKEASIAHRNAIRAERAALMGDPVRGIRETPFLKSFDNPSEPIPKKSFTAADTSKAAARPGLEPDIPRPPESLFEDPEFCPLNHHLTEPVLKSSLSKSSFLTAPIRPVDTTTLDPAVLDKAVQDHELADANAATAVSRIVSLAHGSAGDRMHANVRRCIAAFGRHHTDEFLKPKPPTPNPPPRSMSSDLGPNVANVPVRGGPDTGSPEVQVAILTARIRALTRHIDTIGRTDKMNQRNLRVLVHKRQVMLKYLRKKERGGDRWKYTVDMLGLGDATWRGEITVRRNQLLK